MFSPFKKMDPKKASQWAMQHPDTAGPHHIITIPKKIETHENLPSRVPLEKKADPSLTLFPKNLEHEMKHHVIDIKPKLYYLAKFTQEELESLTDKRGRSFIIDLDKSTEELEATITTYWKRQ